MLAGLLLVEQQVLMTKNKYFLFSVVQMVFAIFFSDWDIHFFIVKNPEDTEFKW